MPNAFKETNEKVPAFGSLCKVIVIDNTIPAVIQEKTFTNKELPAYNTFYKNIDPKRLGKDKLEYVAPFPREEVKNLLSLCQLVKSKLTYRKPNFSKRSVSHKRPFRDTENRVRIVS